MERKKSIRFHFAVKTLLSFSSSSNQLHDRHIPVPRYILGYYKYAFISLIFFSTNNLVQLKTHKIEEVYAILVHLTLRVKKNIFHINLQQKINGLQINPLKNCFFPSINKKQTCLQEKWQTNFHSYTHTHYFHCSKQSLKLLTPYPD